MQSMYVERTPALRQENYSDVKRAVMYFLGGVLVLLILAALV